MKIIGICFPPAMGCGKKMATPGGHIDPYLMSRYPDYIIPPPHQKIFNSFVWGVVNPVLTLLVV